VRYVYEHPKHGRKDIYESMRNAPPHAIVMEGDSWRPWNESDGEDAAWVRVYFAVAAVTKGDGGVRFAGQSLPVSMSAPRTSEQGEVVNRWGHKVRKLKNGSYATLSGDRICATKEDKKRHGAELGITWED